MKFILKIFVILLCTLTVIYCGYNFLKETKLSEGYRLFENVRMASAGNGGITLSEKDAYTLSKYIESLHTAESILYLKGFILGILILLISIFQMGIDKKIILKR